MDLYGLYVGYAGEWVKYRVPFLEMQALFKTS